MAREIFKVETIRLKLPRLPQAFSGFRMAQISDLHMGGWMNLPRLQHAADLIAGQRPDILLMTGDFLLGHGLTDASRQALHDLAKGLTPLAAAIPSFAVLGNHDHWTDASAVREMLCSAGIRDLTNTVFALTRENSFLHLCGVDDIRAGDVRLADVVRQLNGSDCAIVLSHEPDFADVTAATGKFDLQLSGHTHGGQVVIPFFGPPVLPRLGRKYYSGLYKVGEMFQYTSRGLGMSQIAVRINCPPEITIFELESRIS